MPTKLVGHKEPSHVRIRSGESHMQIAWCSVRNAAAGGRKPAAYGSDPARAALSGATGR
jgi:hypothetical protein